MNHVQYLAETPAVPPGGYPSSPLSGHEERGRAIQAGLGTWQREVAVRPEGAGAENSKPVLCTVFIVAFLMSCLYLFCFVSLPALNLCIQLPGPGPCMSGKGQRGAWGCAQSVRTSELAGSMSSLHTQVLRRQAHPEIPDRAERCRSGQ